MTRSIAHLAWTLGRVDAEMLAAMGRAPARCLGAVVLCGTVRPADTKACDSLALLGEFCEIGTFSFCIWITVALGYGHFLSGCRSPNDLIPFDLRGFGVLPSLARLIFPSQRFIECGARRRF